MSFARRVIAVGLVLAALTGSAAYAQEEVEPEYVALEAEPEAAPLEIFEPAPVVVEPVIVVEPTPAPSPTPMPTAVPTAAPTSSPATVLSGKVPAVVVDNRFQTGELTVAVGTTVTWTNNGFNFHTLSSRENLFDSGPLAGGQTFSYTFKEAGSFNLICRQHILNGMTGRITVQ
jgi:plastocyanin